MLPLELIGCISAGSGTRSLDQSSLLGSDDPDLDDLEDLTS